MARAPRTFEVKGGVRKASPIMIGLFGPSGGGKTWSALELGTGIQDVVGGELVFVDTENERALDYADQFKFKHIDFQPPFGSLDYLDVLKHAVEHFGARTVIVDSMSHEHEGPGGMIESHEAELTRMAGNDFAKRERVKMLAWNKPKTDRRALLNYVVRAKANFIFCFRAKHTAKPQRSASGKNEVVDQGYTPIGGEDFVFEMKLATLLRPGAQGVPTWESEMPGERTMIKLPRQFENLRNLDQPLNRRLGRSLAKWAQGGAGEKSDADSPAPPPQHETEPERDYAPPETETRSQRPSDDGYAGV